MLYPSAIREIYFPSFILLTMRIDPIFVDEVCTSQRKNIESSNIPLLKDILHLYWYPHFLPCLLWYLAIVYCDSNITLAAICTENPVIRRMAPTWANLVSFNLCSFSFWFSLSLLPDCSSIVSFLRNTFPYAIKIDASKLIPKPTTNMMFFIS